MYLPSRTSHARLSRARVLRPQPRWVKEDDAIRPRIEEAAPSWIASGARATVKDNGGLATRIAADFPIELVHGVHGQHAVVVRLDMVSRTASDETHDQLVAQA